MLTPDRQSATRDSSLFRRLYRERVDHWLITRTIISLARLVTRNRISQLLITLGATRRLIPGPILSRLRVIGRHQLKSPCGASFTYLANSVDELAPNIIWRRNWESVSLEVFSELCQESRRVLDVGAYSGMYSMVAATDNCAVEIVAIEPNPRILPILKSNISVNGFEGRVQIVEAAANDSGGSGVLYLNRDSKQASLVEGFGTTPQFQEVNVLLKTIDSICEKYGPADLVKIDVEGAELRVLRGSISLINRTRPTFIVELLNVEAFSSTRTFLGKFGYGTPTHLGVDGTTKTDKWQEDPDNCNYLFSFS